MSSTRVWKRSTRAAHLKAVGRRAHATSDEYRQLTTENAKFISSLMWCVGWNLGSIAYYTSGFKGKSRIRRSLASAHRTPVNLDHVTMPADKRDEIIARLTHINECALRVASTADYVAEQVALCRLRQAVDSLLAFAV